MWQKNRNRHVYTLKCTFLHNKKIPTSDLLVVDSWQLERVSEINPGHPWCFCMHMAGISFMKLSKMAVESLRSYTVLQKAVNRPVEGIANENRILFASPICNSSERTYIKGGIVQ
jgi:hypothetical protein